MSQKRNKMDNTRAHKGVLHPKKSRAHYDLKQYPPSEKLQPFIEQFWHVEWDLSGQEPHTQQNLPQPNIHITFESDQAIVYGPVKQRFTRTLSGKGSIFGIKFTTGGFIPLTDKTMAELTDTQTELQDILSQQKYLVLPRISKEHSIEKKIHLAECFLITLFFNEDSIKNIAHLEKHSEKISQAKKITNIVETTSTITKVEQLCNTVNMSNRSLQRLFQTHVGVSPKWLIRKYRIHEILTRLEQVEIDSIDWQQIVFDLDYVDQAHFINDFKAFTGYTPQAYLQRNR